MGGVTSVRSPGLSAGLGGLTLAWGVAAVLSVAIVAQSLGTAPFASAPSVTPMAAVPQAAPASALLGLEHTLADGKLLLKFRSFTSPAAAQRVVAGMGLQLTNSSPFLG